MFTIYALFDPRDRVTRYVGCTVSAIELRLTNHVCASRGKPSAKGLWVRGLLAAGVRPGIRALACARSIDDAEAAERAVIAATPGLLNLRAGGIPRRKRLAPCGHKFSAERKAAHGIAIRAALALRMAARAASRAVQVSP